VDFSVLWLGLANDNGRALSPPGALRHCDRELQKIDWDLSSVEDESGWRSMIPFSEKKIWQRRGFASWLSYYGTGKPKASAEDRHWQRVEASAEAWLR